MPKGVRICSVETPRVSEKKPDAANIQNNQNGLTGQAKTNEISETNREAIIGRIAELELRNLLEEFSDLFAETNGTIRGHEAVVHMTEGAKPKRFAPRTVPFPLRKMVEAEIERLVREDVLEPVDATVTPIEWASPIVPVIKSSKEVRICGDFKVTINPNIISDPHPIPRFQEIAAKLNGGKRYSVIDLKDAS